MNPQRAHRMHEYENNYERRQRNKSNIKYVPTERIEPDKCLRWHKTVVVSGAAGKVKKKIFK